MNFYTYGNIVRILKYTPDNSEAPMMVDVNIDSESILSIFDGSKPFDKSFIEIFLRLLSSPTCGFKESLSSEITDRAFKIAKIHFDR